MIHLIRQAPASKPAHTKPPAASGRWRGKGRAGNKRLGATRERGCGNPSLSPPGRGKGPTRHRRVGRVRGAPTTNLSTHPPLGGEARFASANEKLQWPVPAEAGNLFERRTPGAQAQGSRNSLREFRGGGSLRKQTKSSGGLSRRLAPAKAGEAGNLCERRTPGAQAKGSRNSFREFRGGGRTDAASACPSVFPLSPRPRAWENRAAFRRS
jgi:hypothetical protein